MHIDYHDRGTYERILSEQAQRSVDPRTCLNSEHYVAAVNAAVAKAIRAARKAYRRHLGLHRYTPHQGAAGVRAAAEASGRPVGLLDPDLRWWLWVRLAEWLAMGLLVVLLLWLLLM